MQEFIAMQMSRANCEKGYLIEKTKCSHIFGKTILTYITFETGFGDSSSMLH